MRKFLLSIVLMSACSVGDNLPPEQPDTCTDMATEVCSQFDECGIETTDCELWVESVCQNWATPCINYELECSAMDNWWFCLQEGE
jgi:hypothetical protein